MVRRKKPIVYTIRHSTILLDGTLRPNYPVSPPQPSRRRKRIQPQSRSEASNSAAVSDQPHPQVQEEAECKERQLQKDSSSEKKRKAAGLPHHSVAGVSKVPKGAGRQTSTAKKAKLSSEKTVPDKLPVCGAQKQSQTGRGVHEIDHLFASAKNAKAATAQQESGKKAEASQAAVKGTKDDIFGTGLHKGRRRTEEGYAIYLEDELNLNRGGNTPLCPFDCDCCF